MSTRNSTEVVVDDSPKNPSILAKQAGATNEKIQDDSILQYGCSVAVEKFGCRVSGAEAEAMRLVQEHTDIPSPRVFDTYFSRLG